MFCNNCGQQMDDLATACPNCGTTVEHEPAPTQQYRQQPQQLQQPSYVQSAQYQQPAYQQPVYQQPVYQQTALANEHVSVGAWIGIFLLPLINLIPIIGSLIHIILLFVWAFGSTQKKSLKNWARANLILFAIFFVLGIIGFVIMTAIGVSLTDYIDDFQYSSYY